MRRKGIFKALTARAAVAVLLLAQVPPAAAGVLTGAGITVLDSVGAVRTTFSNSERKAAKARLRCARLSETAVPVTVRSPMSRRRRSTGSTSARGPRWCGSRSCRTSGARPAR